MNKIVGFKRGGNPLERLDIGGFSFDTLKPGAILKTKRWFGVSRSTGIIRGYTSSAIQFRKDTYLLVTKVEPADGKKTISWCRYVRLDWVEEARELLKGGKKGAYGVTSGFFKNLTKIKFDYRMEVIKPGFNESEIRV